MDSEASFGENHSTMLFDASKIHARTRRVEFIGDEAKFFVLNISTSRGAKTGKLNKRKEDRTHS
jgi:hypothetical protein